MQRILPTLLLLLALVPSSLKAQNDSIFPYGKTAITTLIVDFDTYTFEGGSISHFDCPSCEKDEIPFSVSYDSPGDFGGISFLLEPAQDTVFDATIIWMGEGEIYEPESFSNDDPYQNIFAFVEKPENLRYWNFNGEPFVDDPDMKLRADSAWRAIESLQITNIYALNGFEAAIYFYPPAVGAVDPALAKWVIFLYHANYKPSDISELQNKTDNLKVMPIPTGEEQKLTIELKNNSPTAFCIYSSTGKKVKEGILAGNKTELDLSNLASGQYLLELKSENTSFLTKRKIIIE